MKKTLLSFILILTLLLCPQSLVFANTGIHSLTYDTAMYLYSSTPNPEVSSVGGEWAVIGLAASYAEIPSEYFEKYLNNVKKQLKEKNGVLSDRRYTEYSRVVLALSAIGINAQNVSGYDLTKPLADIDKTLSQGLNGAIWALIALKSGNFDISEQTTATYKDKILSAQNADGGWSLSNSAPSDTDITAMALCALAGCNGDENTEKAKKLALDFIRASLNDGKFTSSENISQVIIALCRMGISPVDTNFSFENKSLFANLEDYIAADGGFCHEKNGSANQMATEQALIALSSAKRLNEGKTHIYTGGSPRVSVSDDDTEDNSKTEPKTPLIFSDISGHSAQMQINTLASMGIINGKSENVFDPDSTMTRAEFAAITARALKLEPNGNCQFADVSDDDWFSPYVACAYQFGIVNGVSDDLFAPNSLITTQEAAVMTMRAAKICGISYVSDEDSVRDTLSQFSDYMTISVWAKEAVAFCCDNGIISTDRIEIEPQKYITRAEVAAMIYSLLSTADLL